MFSLFLHLDRGISAVAMPELFVIKEGETKVELLCRIFHSVKFLVESMGRIVKITQILNDFGYFSHGVPF